MKHKKQKQQKPTIKKNTQNVFRKQETKTYGKQKNN